MVFVCLRMQYLCKNLFFSVYCLHKLLLLEYMNKKAEKEYEYILYFFIFIGRIFDNICCLLSSEWVPFSISYCYIISGIYLGVLSFYWHAFYATSRCISYLICFVRYFMCMGSLYAFHLFFCR